MIFVTVGTHEQPFDRLLQCIDKMVGDGKIKEKVIIQKGYTNYNPIHCENYKLIGYEEMNEYVKNARIIITHGGPASFIAPLSIGKIPIVVPRQKKYNEHVNDHQLEFVKAVENKYNNIIGVYDIEDLEEKITNYNKIIENMRKDNIRNNEHFCRKLDEIVREMMS